MMGFAFLLAVRRPVLFSMASPNNGFLLLPGVCTLDTVL
jgi:hypothetical protein